MVLSFFHIDYNFLNFNNNITEKITENILKFIMNLTCPDKMYKLTKKEVIYEFYSRDKMYHEKIFHVDVLHDGFTRITDKFKWTGDEKLNPKAKYENQSIEMLDEKFGMQRYCIKFKQGISYSRHNNVPPMSMIIENITDQNQKSSLHLSTGVFEVTDSIILHIIFDNKLKPINIRKLEFIHYSDDEHYRCTEANYTYNNLTDKKEIIWEIKNPFYGGKYMIDWDFE